MSDTRPKILSRNVARDRLDLASDYQFIPVKVGSKDAAGQDSLALQWS
jgi:hypothetical protein